jgi:sigma-B regulation protein RsbU (phosphoserine phosphatase)
MLGVDAAARLEDGEAELGPGDLLALYTDGVTECKTPVGRFGEERLRELLGGLEVADAAGVTQALVDATVEAPEHATSDDVAVLVLRALPA